VSRCRVVVLGMLPAPFVLVHEYRAKLPHTPPSRKQLVQVRIGLVVKDDGSFFRFQDTACVHGHLVPLVYDILWQTYCLPRA
jgi:hypothetical protein